MNVTKSTPGMMTGREASEKHIEVFIEKFCMEAKELGINFVLASVTPSDDCLYHNAKIQVMSNRKIQNAVLELLFKLFDPENLELSGAFK